jgi:purine-binding chemotaxis protein CheW
MNRLLLVVTIAGRRIAMSADAINSVIELDSLTPVPRAPVHVAGLSALRSRVLTVIDCRCSLELAPFEAEGGYLQAAVVEVGGHLYALLVDAVEDVVSGDTECTPLRLRLGRGWERAALGMVDTDIGPLLLLDVAGIVAGPEEARAA